MLELRDISVGYDRRYSVRHVNLKFEPGKIYGVIGKNGSGKSGLLETCAGIRSPKTGTVLLKGKDLLGYSSKERAKWISYLPQHRKDSRLSAQQLFANRKFPFPLPGCRLSREERSKFYCAMGRMQAAGFAEAPLGDLSRGEQQRVALALVLALDTPVVLLDEPLAFLDRDGQTSFLELLRRLKQQGKTIVLTIHDLPLALRCSDVLVMIDAGKEIYTGMPEETETEGILKMIFHSRGT